MFRKGDAHFVGRKKSKLGVVRRHTFEDNQRLAHLIGSFQNRGYQRAPHTAALAVWIDPQWREAKDGPFLKAHLKVEVAQQYVSHKPVIEDGHQRQLRDVAVRIADTGDEGGDRLAVRSRESATM